MSGGPAGTAVPVVEPSLCFVHPDLESLGVLGPDGDGGSDDTEAALRLVAGTAVEAGFAAPSFVEAVLDRERTHPTGLPVPLPAAIPHAEAGHVLRPALAVLVPRRPLRFGEMGGRDRSVDARLVVMLLVTDPGQQVGLLQRLIGVLRRDDLEAVLLTGLQDGPDLASRLNALLED